MNPWTIGTGLCDLIPGNCKRKVAISPERISLKMIWTSSKSCNLRLHLAEKLNSYLRIAPHFLLGIIGNLDNHGSQPLLAPLESVVIIGCPSLRRVAPANIRLATISELIIKQPRIASQTLSILKIPLWMSKTTIFFDQPVDEFCRCLRDVSTAQRITVMQLAQPFTA